MKLVRIASRPTADGRLELWIDASALLEDMGKRAIKSKRNRMSVRFGAILVKHVRLTRARSKTSKQVVAAEPASTEPAA